jgi:hypothetical protein
MIKVFAYRGLCVTNCEDDGATLLDNLQSLLRAADFASRNPSMSNRKGMPDDVSECLHVAGHVQKDKGSAIHAGDMEVFSVAYVSGSITIQLHHGASCDTYKVCLTSEVLLPKVFKYFNEFSGTE